MHARDTSGPQGALARKFHEIAGNGWNSRGEVSLRPEFLKSIVRQTGGGGPADYTAVHQVL